jgi:hypothetical protein
MANQVQTSKVFHNTTIDDAININDTSKPWESTRELHECHLQHLEMNQHYWNEKNELMQDIYLFMCVWFFNHGRLTSNAFKIFFKELTNESYVCLNDCNQKKIVGK